MSTLVADGVSPQVGEAARDDEEWGDLELPVGPG
jgi:hypothetical protein